MSATPGTVERPPPEIGYWRLRDRSADVSASEPFVVFALKSLLYPTTPVITLILCLIAWREPLRGPYFLIAVLAFLGVADLLDVMPARFLSAWAAALRSLVDITARWGVLLIFVYLLVKLSGLGLALNHPMLWVWALGTPFVLWCAESLAQHALYRSAFVRGPMREAVVVGATPVGARLDKMLAARPNMRIKIGGFFDDRARRRLPKGCAARTLGRLENVKDYVRGHAIDIVYITLPMAPAPAHHETRRIAARLDGFHLFRAGPCLVRDGAAAFRPGRGHSGDRGLRLAVLRRAGAREAHERHRRGRRRTRVARSGHARGRDRREAELAWPGDFQSARATDSTGAKSLSANSAPCASSRTATRATRKSRATTAASRASAHSSARLRSTNCRSSSTC